MRVAFENAAVHERAGVAFIRIADHVFLGQRLARHQFPFEAGGITRSAAAAQTAAAYLGDDFAGSHFRDGAEQGPVAAGGDVIGNSFRVGMARVGEDDSPLAGIERMVRRNGPHRAATDEGGCIGGRHAGGDRVRPGTADERTLAAESHAAGTGNFDLSRAALAGHFALNRVTNRARPAGQAAGYAAAEDAVFEPRGAPLFRLLYLKEGFGGHGQDSR